MANLTFVVLNPTEDRVRVMINGKRYDYEPNDGFSGYSLTDKVLGVYKHSVGKSLALLKKNSQLVPIV